MMNAVSEAEGCGDCVVHQIFHLIVCNTAFHVGRLSSPIQNYLDRAGMGDQAQLWTNPVSEPSQGVHRGNLEVCDGTQMMVALLFYFTF